jgi:hypothetical protein
MFSFLSIYLQRPLFFNSGRNSTDALVDVKYSFIGNGYFYITPCEMMAWRIAKQINFKVPTFMNVLAAKHAELTLTL